MDHMSTVHSEQACLVYRNKAETINVYWNLDILPAEAMWIIELAISLHFLVTSPLFFILFIHPTPTRFCCT